VEDAPCQMSPLMLLLLLETSPMEKLSFVISGWRSIGLDGLFSRQTVWKSPDSAHQDSLLGAGMSVTTLPSAE